MTATEQTIQDAIEGGWNDTYKLNYVESNGAVLLSDGMRSRALIVSEILLDPLAWQAVGKTRGWNNSQYFSNMYKRKWHKFIDYLADGKTTEEALTELL